MHNATHLIGALPLIHGYGHVRRSTIYFRGIYPSYAWPFPVVIDHTRVVQVYFPLQVDVAQWDHADYQVSPASLFIFCSRYMKESYRKAQREQQAGC
jgi:hypothetical protein